MVTVEWWSVRLCSGWFGRAVVFRGHELRVEEVMLLLVVEVETSPKLQSLFLSFFLSTQSS